MKIQRLSHHKAEIEENKFIVNFVALDAEFYDNLPR